MRSAGASSRRLDSWSGRVSVAPAQLDGAVQHRKAGTSRSAGTGKPVAADGFGGIQPAAIGGNWATSLVWGRVHKIATGKSQRIPAGIDAELSAARLCVHAAGTGRQGRIISAGGGASGLSDRGIHVRGRAGSGAESRVATGTGRGCHGLLETRGTGCGLWKLSSFVSIFLRMRPGKRSDHHH